MQFRATNTLEFVKTPVREGIWKKLLLPFDLQIYRSPTGQNLNCALHAPCKNKPAAVTKTHAKHNRILWICFGEENEKKKKLWIRVLSNMQSHLDGKQKYL